MDNLRITDHAVEALHRNLFKYRDLNIDDDSVFEGIEDALGAACNAARKNATDVIEVFDAEDGDYSREIYRLTFQDTNQSVVLFGAVSDDHSRHAVSSRGKVLITLLTKRQAAQSIETGRWRMRNGTKIDVSGFRQAPLPAPPVISTIDYGGEMITHAQMAAAMEAPATKLGGMPGTIKFGSDGKPKKGFRRGGTSQEREAFVLGLLRQHPDMHTMGRDGIHAKVKAAFGGIGMRGSVVARLKAQLAGGGGVAAAPVASDTGRLLQAVHALLEADQSVLAAKQRFYRAKDELRAIYADVVSGPPTSTASA